MDTYEGRIPVAWALLALHTGSDTPCYAHAPDRPTHSSVDHKRQLHAKLAILICGMPLKLGYHGATHGTMQGERGVVRAAGVRSRTIPLASCQGESMFCALCSRLDGVRRLEADTKEG